MKNARYKIKIIGLLIFLSISACNNKTNVKNLTGNSDVTTSINSIEISPVDVTIAINATKKLTAEAKDVNGNNLNVQNISWKSKDESIAVVDSTGLVNGINTGTTIVTASCENKSNSIIIIVHKVIDKIEITPSAASIDINAVKQFTANAKDVNGNIIDVQNFTWSSSNKNIATVDSTGLVKGISSGEATIYVFLEEKAHSVTVSVGVKIAPDFTLIDLNGNNVSLSNYFGKVVIVDFWATWCPSCVKEIPGYISLYETYKGKGLVILGIIVSDQEANVRFFVANNGVSYPVLFGNSAVCNLYGGIKYIPSTFIINRQGEIVKSFVGYEDKSVFEAEINKLL